MSASLRPLVAISALLAPPGRVVDAVLAFAANPADADLAVAVAPERAAALADLIEAEASRRGVALDADIALVECTDRAALRAMLAGADRVLDTGCAYLAADAAHDAGADAAAATGRAPLDLVLVNTYPSDPPRTGGGVRIHALWGAMPADVGARAVTIAHWDAGADEVELTRARPGTERQVAFWPELVAAIRQVSSVAGVVSDDLAAGLAVQPGDPFGRALAETLRDRADGIVLCHPFLVRQALAAAPDLPVVYDSHNVEADLKAAMYRDDPGGREAARMVAELEAEACARARLIVCCTEADRERLQERFGVPAERIHVIPNGVALDDAVHTPWAQRAARAPRCVFAGSAHGPNVEAGAVVAAAANLLPDVGFDLIGDVGGALPADALPANVVAHGRVSDVEKQRLFHEATLALNPMRTGSGSNLKVADYAAAGLPVVTSATGARGFAAELVDCFAVCEPEPAALAAAVRAALGADWSARTGRARAIVEAEYDWRTLARRYADLLHATLAP